MERKPFFYDITLRDGNQALKKPWNLEEKEIIFNKILDLNMQAVEVGFPAASDMDFLAVQKLSQLSSDKNIVISALARTIEQDILKAKCAISEAKYPRIHTFITLSPFHMKYVLNKSPEEVKNIAIDAVKSAKKLLGNKGEVQFSVEHFGDCIDNIDFVISTLKQIVNSGATIINLPNTVERKRPKVFVDMVEKVYNSLPKDIIISVHNHNDLGMATATTVESYFAGAIQLECCLNGIGERAGNTNTFEVAVALYNSGVDVPLNFGLFYETALLISEMANIPIFEKSPLIGKDSLAHRSGIHQDGAIKTKDMEIGAYRPINPKLIGRKDDEIIGFTSQSGKTAIFEIISNASYPITIQEAIRLTPIIKQKAQISGELSADEIIKIYFDEIFDVKGPFNILNFEKISDNSFALSFTFNDQEYNIDTIGNGPIDACINGLNDLHFEVKLINYSQSALNCPISGSSSQAMTVMYFQSPLDNQQIISRAINENTLKANVKAIFNGLNILYTLHNNKNNTSFNNLK